MWALVKDNRIVNVIELTDPADFTTPEGFELVEISSGGIGWAYLNGEVVPPAADQITIETAIASKLADLAAYRFKRETGGITVNGINILTDRESQATLTGAYVAVQLNPDRMIDWKASDSTWTQIDKSTVEFLAGAVADHVQACFSAEKTLSAAIQSLETVDDVLAYDVAVEWP